MSGSNSNRFRGTSAATPPTNPLVGVASSPVSGRRFFKPQAAPTIAAKSQQRVVALYQDVKRYMIRQQHRSRRSSDAALPKYHKTNASGNSSSNSGKAWHVDIPKRMLLSTIAVFLLLPLTIFYWKETHLPEQDAVVTSKGGGMYHHHAQYHDSSHQNAFPNWFADLPAASSSSQDEGDPQINNPQQLVKVGNVMVTPAAQEGDDHAATVAASPPQLDVIVANDNNNTTDMEEEIILDTHVTEAFNDTTIAIADQEDPLSNPEGAAQPDATDAAPMRL